jgi:CheY-like chemotaxis protein
MNNFEDNTSKERDSTHYDVFIISNNPTTIRLIKRYFKLKSCTSKAFTSGAEALKEMQTNIPRFIIMDELFCDVSAYEILRTLKSDVRLKDIPIKFF